MSGAEVEERQALEWTVRLWESAPERRWIVLLVAFGCAGLGWALFHAVLLALVGFAAIAGSTTEYWLPLRYKVDPAGASVRCGIGVTEIRWPDVKRIAETEVGMRLSPLKRPTRLAEFRGVFLRYAGNRDEVLEYVNSLRGEGARLLEQRTYG